MRFDTFTSTIFFAALSAIPACVRHEATPPTKGHETMTTSSADVVRSFFAAFGKGDVDGVVDTFHPEAEIVAVRRSGRKDGELYGRYAGKEGAKAFVATLGKTFDTKAFSVDRIGGDGELAFANGSFTHHVRATGRPFHSDWALVCVVREGKIREYRFFEDSAAFAEASR